MNVRGAVQAGFPRVTLSLVDRSNALNPVTFVVDTGFEGEIALPFEILRIIYTFAPEIRRIQPVNSDERDSTFVRALLATEDGERRVTEVLVLDQGLPLVGLELLWDHLLTMELTNDGDVTIEQL